MEPVVIDFEYLKGRQNQMVVKEAAVAGGNISESFRFEPPYYMAPHGSAENGLNWDDGNIPYQKLATVLKEAVANLAHVYSIGQAKCSFLTAFLQRTVLDLEEFKCPPVKDLKSTYTCTLPCHRQTKFSCAAKSAHAFYGWLMHHLQNKAYVTCPPDMSRHTAEFISAIGTNSSSSDWSI